MPDPPCPGQPVAARLSIRDASTESLVAMVTSGHDGQFSIAVQPGMYLVAVDGVVGAPSGNAGSVVVTVALGSYTTITVHIDRGVR